MEWGSTGRRKSGSTCCRKRYSRKRFSDESTLKKDSFSDTKTDVLKINYQDEMVSVLFASMLDIIVLEWKQIPTDIDPICVCKQLNLSEIKDGSIQSALDLSETTSQGSKSSRKGSICSSKSEKCSYVKRRLSRISEKSASSVQLFPETSKTSSRRNTKVSVATGESTTLDNSVVDSQAENVRIIFRNGNQYEGNTFKKLMHGCGRFTWSDGTIYEGDFENGFATGHGVLRYPDLTIYHGEFCKSALQGYGELNIALSPMMYCGYWKNGEKHGTGWMLYDTDDWYDGEWFNDQRHGKGIRNYKTGDKYQGDWCQGMQDGNGTFVWTNNDVYKGEWKEGKMHGYGEYAWNAFLNQTFTYPVQNIYKGNWANGLRHGAGILDFGFETGTKLTGIFHKNKKQGTGILVCGNGSLVEQSILFWNDNLINSDAVCTAVPVTPSSTTEEAQKSCDSSSNLDSQNLSTCEEQSSLQQFLCIKGFDSVRRSTHCSILTTRSTPSQMPIHLPPEDTDFSFYIELAVQEYTAGLFKEQLASVDLEVRLSRSHQEPSIQSSIHKHHNSENQTSLQALNYDSLLAMLQVQQHEIEKKNLKDAVIINLPRLYKVYDKYATIATYKKLTFRPILIRYFFWQFIRDIKFLGTKNSLVEIDLIVFENPNSGLESPHWPFEKIYFWQFLQILLCLAWKFHSAEDVIDECKTYGILAALFVNFLNRVVYPNPIITKSYSLFEFRDLLSITAVYELYKTIGEPHTARKFLNALCVKKNEDPPCYLSTWDDTNIEIRPNGKNAVPIGGNVTYMEDKITTIGEPLIPNEIENSEDPFKNQLLAFRILGPRRVMQCLTSICPLISSDGLIVNIEYPLSFIDFYDAILMCTLILVQMGKRHIQKLCLQKVNPCVKETEGDDCSCCCCKYKKLRKSSKESDSQI